MAVTYLDSSAIVKLVISEPESHVLRQYLRGRQPTVSSALARIEVMRALLGSGKNALDRGRQVLSRINLIRINDKVLKSAGTLLPSSLRALDAVHIATARTLGSDLSEIVTYDVRMANAAAELGHRVLSPA